MCPHGTFWFFNGEKEASVFRLINGNKQMTEYRGTPWGYEQLGCRRLGAASVGVGWHNCYLGQGIKACSLSCGSLESQEFGS